MLTIRSAQLSALEQGTLADCARRLVKHLAEAFPKQARLLGKPGMQKVVELGMTRAAGHGLEEERDLFLYLTLMMMLGSWFDEDPQLAWAGKRLGDQRIQDPADRLDKLHDVAMQYLDRIAGENNELLVKALIRVRDFDPSKAESIPAAELEPGLVAMLSPLYPQKAQEQGEAGMRAVARHGVELAGQYGAGGNQAACLFAGLAFMLGWGFDHDPQFPWVCEALGEDGKKGDLGLLHRGAMTYLKHGLEPDVHSD